MTKQAAELPHHKHMNAANIDTYNETLILSQKGFQVLANWVSHPTTNRNTLSYNTTGDKRKHVLTLTVPWPLTFNRRSSSIRKMRKSPHTALGLTSLGWMRKHNASTGAPRHYQQTNEQSTCTGRPRNWTGCLHSKPEIKLHILEVRCDLNCSKKE